MALGSWRLWKKGKMTQAENHEEKPSDDHESYSHRKKKGNESRGFPMGRDDGEHMNVETLDSRHVIDLTLILNLVALIFSMILCYLLFQAI